MYTTINRAAVIASIIEKRRPLAEKIASVENNLQTLSEALRSLEDHRKQLLTQVDEDIIIRRLREIDLTSSQSRIEDELKALSQLKARFCRKTLNIGVVGLARQGKSRLLQSLTGLSAAEIPDGDGQHCTGVRSTIYHNPSTETYGEVLFHSERSFLNEVIAPYYEKLQLGAKPISIEEFASKPLPALPKHASESAKLGAMYEHLQRYYINFEKYHHLLRESPRRIPKNQIREYVAQDTLNGQRIYFNYLAVKEVKIFCQFPNADVENIALVDMPGLGDTGIGDEERLMKTLGRDVDAVLFVRMPKPSGDYWGKPDVDLYDVARASLPDLPLDLWSFMVLNNTNANSKLGNNLNNCQGLAGDISNKHIKVIEPFIANCASSEEASSVLDKVLNYLAAKITDLDEKYAFLCQQKLIQLQSYIYIELQKCQNTFASEEAIVEEDEIFEDLFEEFWNNLSSSLIRLVTEFREKSDNDNYFVSSIDSTIDTCKSNTAIPSNLKEIKDRRDSMGSYNKAYDQYLDEVRTCLTQHFLTLDKGLNYSIQKAQEMVAQVLVEQGHLGGLTEARGIDFIQFMAQELPEKYNNLKRGFQLLSTFELSFRGLAQPRIRKHLNDLIPDAKAIPLSNSQLEEEIQKEIQENLQTLHAEALDKCKVSLYSMLSEPSQAALAIVEEFVDQALRAKGISKEWRLFLKKQKTKVWSEKFAQLDEQFQMRQRWLNIVQNAIFANQSKSMQYLNC